MSSGKGSNMVISLLHHFFEHYGLGKKRVDLHCDNCAGQNKNRYVIAYFLWRVMSGLHEVKLNFKSSGHTKFAPDLYRQKRSFDWMANDDFFLF